MDIKLPCTHQHSLSYNYITGWETDRKWCEVCGKEISKNGYTCERCKVWLHESCANELQHLPHEIIHPLHPQHHLKLQLQRPWDFICDQCLYISDGSRYNCSSCDFNLDLTCASSAKDQLLKEKWSRFQDEKKRTIQHYSHIEKLTLFKYRKIKEQDYDCIGCEKRLLNSDLCYGCRGCGFFLHEVCRDKIPRTLYHPFHPSHPLHLHYLNSSAYYCSACGESIFFRTSLSTSYWCQICSFRLDLHCAKLLPTLKHKCHNHLLTYFPKVGTEHRQHQFQCSVCHKLCDANFYRCVHCDFNFHVQCVIPSSAKHKYHRHPLILMNPLKEDDSEKYYCDVCENERNPKHPVYCCEKCRYIVHIECIVNEDDISFEDSKALLVKEMEHNEATDDIHTSQQLLIQPLFHRHPMRFEEVTENFEKKRYCNACRLVLSGPSYICSICPAPYAHPEKEYCLHEKCTKLSYEIQHPFHSSHPLNLYTTDRPDIGIYIRCDECRDICLGFIYLCEVCNFKLDVKCATTEVSQTKEMDRVTELHHFNHLHNLIFGNSSDPISEIECSICELSIVGPAYFCPGTYCCYIIHESCLGLPQKIQVPFHPEHMSVMRFGAYIEESKCYACHLGIRSSLCRYICEQCDVHLHSICVNSLRRPLKYESHGHDLYYFGINFQLLFVKYWWAPHFSCSACQKIFKGRPFYRCLQCAINFHLECVPIPHIVKSIFHIHPLIMKDSFVEDNSGEYYCDICEEERCGNDHVYYCEECNDLFVAHIECVLTKVENVLSYLDPQDRKESPIHEINLVSESNYIEDESPVQAKEEEDSTALKS
ncbi:hypothetical protein REPUB_Repub16aG0107600 [Reevesia pubescens]